MTVEALDGPAALARKREVEGRLGALDREDPSKRDEHEALKTENTALDARLKEQAKVENTISGWVRRLGWNRKSLAGRIAAGWSHEKAIKTPMGKNWRSR